MMQQATPQWSSFWVFILVTVGAAVGLGNIWKFPYIAGENGGGAFVAVYLLCVFFIGTPLIIAEIMMGRATGKNPVDATIVLAKRNHAKRFWGAIGGFTTIAGFLILSYYSVIAGWSIAYVFKSASGVFYHSSTSQVDEIFNQLVSSPTQLLFWHSVMMLTTVLVICSGVRNGLERVGLYLFPSMLVLLLVMVIYAFSTGYFSKGIAFLFAPDFHKLTGEAMLNAAGHAFFTLSVATGSIMMYGAYLPRRIDILSTSIVIVVADTLIALLAGLAIFPIVFSFDLKPGMGPGLIFETLPLAFGQMPYGSLFGTLFFIMLVLAAFTSAVSFLEPTSAWLMERFAIARPKAAVTAGVLIWLTGLATVFSFNRGKHIRLFGMNMFDAIDMLTANIMLPLAGMMIALFAAWILKNTREELDLTSYWLFNWWRYSLGILVPIAIVFIFIHAMGA